MAQLARLTRFLQHSRLMSTQCTISIMVSGDCDMNRVVMIVRPITKVGISEIRDAVKNHLPIYNRQLFMNDHDEVAVDLRALTEQLQDAGVGFEVREDGVEVGVDVLRNMLDSHDERAESNHT